MTSMQDEQTESALAALFDALALVLIRLGITPARLAHIARSSFVKAGAQQARKRSSGRPHLARIAALTGLSRTEVKRIVSSNFSYAETRIDSSPRALRVLNAWKQSSKYSIRGRPRQLKLTGRAPSFFSLCQSHSGDIPHRVILDELELAGLISFNKQKTRVSVVHRPKKATAPSGDRESLVFAANFLQEALLDDAVLVRRKQRVHTSSTVPSAYIERAIAGRVTELMDQIPNLFPKSRPRKHEYVDVFAVVARKPRVQSKKEALRAREKKKRKIVERRDENNM